jgi:hypothetical protein
MRTRCLLVAILAALLGCAYRPPPGLDPLAPYPAGTVDTTHGAEGAQTSPR